MNTTRSIRTLLAASLPALLAMPAVSNAALFVTRGWILETAELRGKSPNTTYELWVNGHTTLRTLRTDGAGNASDWWIAGAGLQHWQENQSVEARLPNGSVTWTRTVAGTYVPFCAPSLPSGQSPATFQLANASGGTYTLVQTFTQGTQITVSVNPSQAQLVNRGVTVTAPGMALTVMQLTPSQLTFVVGSNSSPTTPNVITISGLDLNVTSPVGGGVAFTLAAQGSTSVYLDGALLHSNVPLTFASTSHVLQTSVVVPPQQCGSADFNHDGDLGTDQDIQDFFSCLGGQCCPTCEGPDFDGDGDIGTDADIEAFFRVLGGGPC